MSPGGRCKAEELILNRLGEKKSLEQDLIKDNYPLKYMFHGPIKFLKIPVSTR